MESNKEHPESKQHRGWMLLFCLLAVLSSGFVGYILGTKDSLKDPEQNLELVFLISDPPESSDPKPEDPNGIQQDPFVSDIGSDFEDPTSDPIDSRPDSPKESDQNDPDESSDPMIPIEPIKPTDPRPHGPDHDLSPIDPEHGGLDVLDPNGNSWSETGIIECFKDQNGPIKLQPGTSGQAQLQLINDRSKDLRLSFIFIEDQIHLPLNLTLKPLDQNGDLHPMMQEAKGKLRNGKCELSNDWILGAGKTMDLVFEWEWPLEGEDIIDTLAGKSGLEYKLNIKIQADEVSS